MKITILARKGFTIVLAKIVDIWQRVDVEAGKEDVRKLALVLVGGGLAGMFFINDKIMLGEGLYVFIFGTILWIVGLINWRDKDDE